MAKKRKNYKPPASNRVIAEKRAILQQANSPHTSTIPFEVSILNWRKYSGFRNLVNRFYGRT